MDGPLEEPYERNQLNNISEDPFLQFSALNRLFSVSLLSKEHTANLYSKLTTEAASYAYASEPNHRYPVSYSSYSESHSEPITPKIKTEEIVQRNNEVIQRNNEPIQGNSEPIQRNNEPIQRNNKPIIQDNAAIKKDSKPDKETITGEAPQKSSKPEEISYRPYTKIEETNLDSKILAELQKKEDQKFEKWKKILPTFDLSLPKSKETVKALIRKGIPATLRGTVWPMLANVEAVKKSFSDINYKNILFTDNIPFKEEIYKDVLKTCSTVAEQRALAKVLSAITIAYRQIGYCRGLNFICSMLLKFCCEEDAFWIMISLMENYDLLGYYKDIAMAGKQLLTLDALMNVQFPKLSAHLADHRVQSINFSINWWMTLFTGNPGLPFNTVARIVDTLLFEKQKILYRVSLAILKLKEKDLMFMKEADAMMSFITSDFRSAVWFDEDAFMKTIFAIQLSRKDIERIKAQYEDNH